MKYKLTISCNKSNLQKVRHFVDNVLARNNIRDMDAHKLILAVDEVCANLIIHSNQCNPSQKIEIHIDFAANKFVVFEIKDQGKRFDPSLYAEPSLEEIVLSKRKGGVGLMLVKRIMDKIEFSTNKNYNICRLTKNLNQ